MTLADLVRHLNQPMLDRLRKCAADTSPNWDGAITVYPNEARQLVALIDAVTDDEAGEERTEFAVRWHGTDDGDAIRLSQPHIPTREQADAVGPSKVGTYAIVRWTVWQRLHRIYADGSSWTGPWQQSPDVERKAA